MSQAKAATAHHNQSVLPLGVILFVDGLEIESSRVKSAIGLYISLCNDSFDHLCSIQSLEPIAILPMGVDIHKAIDVIIVQSMLVLEQGYQFYWPLTGQHQLFIGNQ